MSEWTDDHIRYLRDLMKMGGYSRSQIAYLINERFRTSYSRNSVIGKCNRMGLTTDLPAKPGKGPSKILNSRPYKPRPKSASAIQASQHAEMRHQREPAVVGAGTVHEFDGIDPLDLREGDCRWPTGDNVPYAFCGRPVCPESSYCSEHYAASVRPWVSKRAA